MATGNIPKKHLPPMSDKVNMFIEVRTEAISSQYDDQGKRGKWMLFFPIEVMNEKWERACKLYNAGKLPGIISIKTSTAASNPRSTETKNGAIRFACGPSDNELQIKAYGKALIKKFAYYGTYGFVAYKTDEQTGWGTRATGNRSNFIYRLEVPKKEYSALPSQTNDKDGIELPSEVTDRQLLIEVILTHFEKYDCGIAFSGRWKMNVDIDDLDDVWVEAVELFRLGKLTGIQSLSINTVSETRTDKAIFFRCSPCNKEDVVQEYGRIVLKYLGKYCCTTTISYKGTHLEYLKVKNVRVTFPYILRVGNCSDETNSRTPIDLSNEEEDSVLELLKKM